jgi:hypothetical protein
MFDKELTRQQIQNLNNAEGLTAFFAYLGYDTNNRVPQKPASLGIIFESTQRQSESKGLQSIKACCPFVWWG